jgi:uncharacterized membrane protein
MDLRRGKGIPSSEAIRVSLWFWPATVASACFLVTVLLLRFRPDPASRVARLVWPGEASTATALMQTVATASMTAFSLTFSLTIVALQLASQQFSPRLLRSFARDWIAQVTMAVLVSAVVVSLTSLAAVRAPGPLPVLAPALTLLLGLGGLAMLVAFVAHIVRRLRVDTMMTAVHQDTASILQKCYPLYGQACDPPATGLPGPEGGVVMPACRSGFVRTIDAPALVKVACRHQVLLWLTVHPGDSVIIGTPVASAFARDGAEISADALSQDLGRAVILGAERTEEQDIAFGLRQLADIAVRAASPALNDPTTTAEALGYCADLLVQLQSRHLAPRVHHDRDGRPAVVVTHRDLKYYLDLTCSQIRRSGRREPTILTAILRLLRDLAVHARDEGQRAEIATQVSLVLAELPDDLIEEDARYVHDTALRVRSALCGDVDTAYRDITGRTRSI